jgi:hypothetical protein
VDLDRVQGTVHDGDESDISFRYRKDSAQKLQMIANISHMIYGVVPTYVRAGDEPGKAKG